MLPAMWFQRGLEFRQNGSSVMTFTSFVLRYLDGGSPVTRTRSILVRNFDFGDLRDMGNGTWSLVLELWVAGWVCNQEGRIAVRTGCLEFWERSNGVTSISQMCCSLKNFV